jgi:hypothetical protein
LIIERIGMAALAGEPQGKERGFAGLDHHRRTREIGGPTADIPRILSQDIGQESIMYGVFPDSPRRDKEGGDRRKEITRIQRMGYKPGQVGGRGLANATVRICNAPPAVL